MTGDVLSKMKLKDKIFDFTINYGSNRNLSEIDNVIPLAPENIELLEGSNILEWTDNTNLNNLTSYRLNIETESKSLQLKHLKKTNSLKF